MIDPISPIEHLITYLVRYRAGKDIVYRLLFSEMSIFVAIQWAVYKRQQTETWKQTRWSIPIFNVLPLRCDQMQQIVKSLPRCFNRPTTLCLAKRSPKRELELCENAVWPPSTPVADPLSLKEWSDSMPDFKTNVVAKHLRTLPIFTRMQIFQVSACNQQYADVCTDYEMSEDAVWDAYVLVSALQNKAISITLGTNTGNLREVANQYIKLHRRCSQTHTKKLQLRRRR